MNIFNQAPKQTPEEPELSTMKPTEESVLKEIDAIVLQAREVEKRIEEEKAKPETPQTVGTIQGLSRILDDLVQTKLGLIGQKEELARRNAKYNVTKEGEIWNDVQVGDNHKGARLN